jgi:hypothetical protein
MPVTSAARGPNCGQRGAQIRSVEPALFEHRVHARACTKFVLDAVGDQNDVVGGRDRAKPVILTAQGDPRVLRARHPLHGQVNQQIQHRVRVVLSKKTRADIVEHPAQLGQGKVDHDRNRERLRATTTTTFGGQAAGNNIEAHDRGRPNRPAPTLRASPGHAPTTDIGMIVTLIFVLCVRK